MWEADCASRAQTGKAGGQYPGCTAMAALLVGNDLYVANAGKHSGKAAGMAGHL